MIYFISGHRDITREEFEKMYIPALRKVSIEDIDASFVVGDYEGVDKMAMDYLFDYGYDFTVYHMFDYPRNTPNNMEVELCKENGVEFVGGFMTDEARDNAMTIISDADIAFIREGRWDSGTAQNIKRRHSIRKDG